MLIGRDGQFFDAVLRREHLSHGDVEQSLREADCTLAELGSAYLESDGSISIQKKA